MGAGSLFGWPAGHCKPQHLGQPLAPTRSVVNARETKESAHGETEGRTHGRTLFTDDRETPRGQRRLQVRAAGSGF